MVPNPVASSGVFSPALSASARANSELSSSFTGGPECCVSIPSNASLLRLERPKRATEIGASASPRERWDQIKSQWMGGLALDRNTVPSVVLEARINGVFGNVGPTDEFNRAALSTPDYDLLAAALSDAWTSAEFPSRVLSNFLWEGLFQEVGFIENEMRADVPAAVPVLYRATVVDPADDEGRLVAGMSWTDDFDTALWFHRRNELFGFEAVLIGLENPMPGAVLARFHGEESGNEDEWVLSATVVEDCELHRIDPDNRRRLTTLVDDQFV